MKVGFVSLIGRPNVGKSSLLNAILEFKISITSPVPQTTRALIKGIYQDDDSQIIFIDTPGLHKPKSGLGKILNTKSREATEGSEIVLFLQPLNEKIGPGDLKIVSELPQNVIKVGVITKIDTASPIEISVREKKLKALGFEFVFGVSVMKQQSIKKLISFLKTHLSEGEPFYGPEDLTDRSARFLVQEQIRETAINLLHDELPHSMYVEIDDYNETNVNMTIITATIYVERESQKAILIGKSGAMIKNIGTNARRGISEMLAQPVRLFLTVKVNLNWTKKATELKKFEE